MALAAVDTALWDLLGKAAELPLYKMLGAVRDEVPVYATGGWFTYSKEELVEECLRFSELGYRDYKMKVGHQDWQIDIKRVEYVAARINQHSIRLMVDANQAWTVEQAIPAGRALAELGVVWFEEPVVVQDLDGCARIAAEVDIPLATGESLFTRHGFRPWIERRAADVLMPDLMRCGGPTEFMHVAQMADDQRLPISSHTFAEQSSHLIAASVNGLSVEIVPGWFDGLFDAAPEVSDGKMRLSNRPGLGIRLSERAVAEYSSEAAKVSAVRV
jgi:L-alanine-DL-glutamate epimerase-like enolase superfamily enzyme